jgi:urease accessory protein
MKSLAVFGRSSAVAQTPALVLTLTYEQRQKARLRAHCDEGEEVAVMVERGQVLRGDTLLADAAGRVLRVAAALESVSVVVCDEPVEFARAAYHLGNRHVALEIAPGKLSYLADHVLDDMMGGLGFVVLVGLSAFEPEAGAYSHGHNPRHERQDGGTHADHDHQ